MINGFKRLIIPEGVVTRIKDSNNNTLWEMDENYVKFSSSSEFSVSVSTPVWTGTIEYSYDKIVWNTWDGSAVSGLEIFFRGYNNTQVSMDIDEVAGANWVLTGTDIYGSGNLDSLLDYRKTLIDDSPAMGDYCYCSMFFGQDELITAPDLPNQQLSPFCYAAMFYNCKKLIKTPSLPATNLADYCYYAMFSQCSNLVETGALPATTLTSHCYDGMFENCENLKYLPKLPAETLVDSCYRAMFYYCKQFGISSTASEGRTQEYRIPFEKDGTAVSSALAFIVNGAGGNVNSLNLNTTYYVNDDIIIV